MFRPDRSNDAATAKRDSHPGGRYASLNLAGRLPVERLVDRRIGLDDLESAFDRLRAGEGLRQVVVFD